MDYLNPLYVSHIMVIVVLQIIPLLLCVAGFALALQRSGLGRRHIFSLCSVLLALVVVVSLLDRSLFGIAYLADHGLHDFALPAVMTVRGLALALFIVAAGMALYVAACFLPGLADEDRDLQQARKTLRLVLGAAVGCVVATLVIAYRTNSGFDECRFPSMMLPKGARDVNVSIQRVPRLAVRFAFSVDGSDPRTLYQQVEDDLRAQGVTVASRAYHGRRETSDLKYVVFVKEHCYCKLRLISSQGTTLAFLEMVSNPSIEWITEQNQGHSSKAWRE